MTTLNSAVATPAAKLNSVDSSRTMRTDREAFGRIIGHLHMAARTLLEGKITTLEKMRHEIRKMLHAVGQEIQKQTAESGIGMPMSYYGSDPGVPNLSLPDGHSVQAWNSMIDYMTPLLKKLPNGPGVFPDELKVDIAKVIKTGIKLCTGGTEVAAHARKEVDQAVALYRHMSGRSYL